MQKWLDDQITLVSGAQVKPTPPVPRPAPTSRSPSKHVYRNKKKWENNNLKKHNSPSGARKSSCKTSQRRKSFSSSSEGSRSGRNLPYAHQSRSSSSDGERYDVNLQRSSSIQSVLSSLDSAGGLLLGRHVLAPRRDHGNRLYLGVIKTQKRSKRFGVVFCIPYAGHGGEEGLEYCMQEVEIDDIFSYTDLYRHAVCEKDDVLVPACLLQPRDGDGTRPEAPVDPPYAGQPYVLAVVHKGFEPRSSRRIGLPRRKTASLVVKVAGGERPRLCAIPVRCALWIPEKQAHILYSQNCHFYDQKPSGKRDLSPFHEEHESLCMHGGPNSPSHRTDNGDVDSQHSYKSSDLFRRSVDSAESGSPSNVRRRNRSFRARSHADTESNNSDGFSALEKRSQSSSRCSENNNSITKRPIWQYWGRAQIPDLLDPPSHEPYIPMQVFGPAALVNSQPGNEWPAAHFAVVNRSVDSMTAQNDSTRVYEAMRQIQNSPTVPKSTDISVTRNQPNTSEDGGFGSFLHKSPFRNDRLAGVSRRDLYRRNLLKNCKETKTNSALDLNRHHSITKSVRSQ